MRCVAAFLLLASVAYGQVRISGPVTAAPGTLVELRATGAEAAASSRAWLTVSELEYREYEAGQVLVFATLRPGQYEFALIAVSVDAGGKPAVAITKHRVTISGSPVPPTPGPTPPTPPTPVPPAPDTDRLGLVRAARESAPSDRPDERAKLRANFRAVASQIAAGTLKSVSEARDKIRALNREAVGNPAADDHPWHRFAMATGTRLDELVKSGQLQAVVSEWQDALLDIARGLD